MYESLRRFCTARQSKHSNQIYICSLDFTPSHHTYPSKRGEGKCLVQLMSTGSTTPDVYWGQTYDVMNKVSQVHSFYVNILFTNGVCKNFLHSHKNIYLPLLFLRQQLSWFFSCTIWRVDTRNTLLFSGLPWWRSGWESACQCRGHGFEPWSGKIPHSTEQLSPCATTTEPVL